MNSHFNFEGFQSQNSSHIENYDEFAQRLENNPESVTDSDILSKFDSEQLECIRGIQDNPTWNELDLEGKYEAIKERISNFCHGTAIGRYWSNPQHFCPMVACIVRNIHKI